MATIKSFTSLEQSRKLAEILPIESADYYHATDAGIVITAPYITYCGKERCVPAYKGAVPCWSLVALLATLPNEIITDNRFECHYQIHIRKYDGGDNTTLYQIAYGNNRGLSGSWHDMINTGEKESLIDCCVQMIIKLKEMNLI